LRYGRERRINRKKGKDYQFPYKNGFVNFFIKSILKNNDVLEYAFI